MIHHFHGGHDGPTAVQPDPLPADQLTKYKHGPLEYKKLSYCWETVQRESMPRIAEMDMEMTT